MLIVAGHLVVDPAQRDRFVQEGRRAVELARAADGCLDFAQSPDGLDPARVNVYERWTDEAALLAFRGSGPSGEQAAQIVSASVRRYRVTDEAAP